MIPHLAIVRRQPPNLGFVPIYRSASGWTEPGSAAARSLPALIAEALDWMRRTPHADFSFSTCRTAADFETDSALGLTDEPTTLLSGVMIGRLPGAFITALLPAGRPDREELWGSLLHADDGLRSHGKSGTFVEGVLADRIRTFVAGIDARAFEGGTGRERKELWIRRNWRAADMFPDEAAFQTPPPFPSRTAVQEAKRQAYATEQRRREAKDREIESEAALAKKLANAEMDWKLRREMQFRDEKEAAARRQKVEAELERKRHTWPGGDRR